jgi:hypothetical protein
MAWILLYLGIALNKGVVRDLSILSIVNSWAAQEFLIFFAFAYVTTDTIAIKTAKYFFIFITVYLDLFISR